ncbi:MAG TPA: sodium:calcium antiporter [Noviherbaspirillum sp.]
MNPFLLIWIQFVACMLVIGFAGVRLIRYGDAIASLAGFSRSWVGLILVATVTSLPELVTGLSAVTIAKSPDIAVGDALGSCVFNLAILALVDIFYRKEPVYAIVSSGHLLSAGFGVILLAAAALVLVLNAHGILPGILHFSWGSLLIITLYVWAMRTIYLAEQRHHVASNVAPPQMSLRTALTGYTLTAAVIVGAGILLPMIGVELADIMGWSDSFVGTLFIAMATSVPEIATTWGALRIGAVDLAMGNLLGSNLFDVLIIAFDDIAYLPGDLYAEVSGLHILSALSACLMSGTVIVALAFRPASRVWHIGSWASLGLLLMYLLNTLVQYAHGN